MRRWLWGCGLVVLVAASSSAAFAAEEQEQRTLEVRVNEQKSISARNVVSYSEGTEGIADIRVTNDQKRFVIVGRRVGTTSLLLIMNGGKQVQYMIRVAPEGSKGLTARENIRLDLYFVLVRDRYGHRIGLGWPGQIGGGDANVTIQGGTGVGTTTQFQILPTTVLPTLDLAQERGWAKLYRQAALITANGTEAVFSSGGEFNIQVVNNLATGIESIEFGTNIRVVPRYDADTGRIELQITADVSDLDARPDPDQVPGRIVSHLETLVNLELGQAVSLAGLISRTERRTRGGLPGLGTLPFVGALFGSHSREREELEAFMFMVPSVVEPVSVAQRNRIEEAMRTYEDFRGGVPDTQLLEQPKVGRHSRRRSIGK